MHLLPAVPLHRLLGQHGRVSFLLPFPARWLQGKEAVETLQVLQGAELVPESGAHPLAKPPAAASGLKETKPNVGKQKVGKSQAELGMLRVQARVFVKLCLLNLLQLPLHLQRGGL